MASIKDVAQRAGVGVGTVSRVLNDSGYVAPETRRKIEGAIKELGYIPNELARNLFRNHTGIIGVIVPDLDHVFFSSFVREVEISLYHLGYKTMVCNTVGTSNREKEYLEMLERNMVDGIITGAHTLEVEEYVKRNKPIVSLDRDFGPKVPVVCSEHELGGKIAAEILVKNKCKKVLHFTGVAPGIIATSRHAVFENYLKENGVEVVNKVVDWNLFDHETWWKIAGEAFEENEGVDGVFGTDEEVLVYVNLAMTAGKRVPEDLKVITYDGMPITKLYYPKVTAICQNVPLLAETCANTVVDMIEGRKNVPHKQLIAVGVQQRDSTYPVEIGL